jgi:hypothetical protein
MPSSRWPCTRCGSVSGTWKHSKPSRYKQEGESSCLLLCTILEAEALPLRGGAAKCILGCACVLELTLHLLLLPFLELGGPRQQEEQRCWPASTLLKQPLKFTQHT